MSQLWKIDLNARNFVGIFSPLYFRDFSSQYFVSPLVKHNRLFDEIINK
jgi:hypothetical protein